jgi:phosphoglycerate dehydrogenase-like enzyme
MTDKPRVLIAIPQPLRDLILTPDTLADLRSFADVTLNEDGRNWSEQELAAQLPGIDALLASWGIARLASDTLAGADRLRLVAYAAGSVKPFVTDAVYDRGIRVTHAAPRIAESVADITLLLAMVGLRRPQDFDRRLKAGEPWPNGREVDTYEIRGKTVGLLGLGYVGRRTAALFQAVGASVWGYDPYVSERDAAALGIRRVGLDELLGGCKIISVHLPSTEETHHMLGARELGLINDGAVFINTARAWVVDQDALLQALQSGRFWAALDVYDPEPLALDSPLRSLDNVLLTPHIAGMTRDSYHGLTQEMVDEIRRLLVERQPLTYEITRERLAQMA